MTKLEAAIAAAEMYCQATAFDCHSIVTDDKGVVLCFVPAKTYKIEVKIGEPLAGGKAAGECISTRSIITRMLPEHLYGVRLKVKVVPIIEDDGTLSGTTSIGTSLKMQDTLHSAAQSISTTAQQMMAVSEELAVTAGHLSDELKKVKGGGETVLSEIQKTDEILRFVREVADNSNLLGLNAAIEAARAGEVGRGFAVVADEIRKMATNSSQSVKDINAILRKIQEETRVVVDTIARTAELGERQAAATEEISATMQELTSTAAGLEKIAEG